MGAKNQKFYITTPIYYVNAQPHLGHTYTTVAADVLARFARLVGKDVFFLTGTDEHGAKIASKAKEEGMSPQQWADMISAKFQLAWDELNISHNNFIRTTSLAHQRAVQYALQYMFDKGDIYLGKYEGWYCQGCEQYKSEKDLVDGLCPDHQHPPERMSEETYIFRLSKYAPILAEKIAKDEIKIRPLERKKEILSFYQGGVKDVSFSRRQVKWGIPMPWDEDHTAYVWADAFLNYLTGLNWNGEGEKAPNFWPPELQLMIKDILRVHATIWLAMLLSLDLALPKQFFVHGFFLIDGQKMSKSLGNVISPFDLKDKYGTDGARYLLMSATTFGRDGDISWAKLDEKYQADLAKGLGNLASRLTAMAAKLRQQGGELKEGGAVFKLPHLLADYQEAMTNIRPDEALAVIWRMVGWCDKYITEHKPFNLIGKNNLAAGRHLYVGLESLRIISVLLWPFMPETAEKIWQSLGWKTSAIEKERFDKLVSWGMLSAGVEIQKIAPLFPRI